MIRKRSKGAARAASAVLASAILLGAAPAAPVSTPASALLPLPDLGASTTVTRLATGGVGIVRPLAGAPVAAVELWYRAPSTGFDPKPAPSIARVAAQVVAASKPLVGPTLGDVVKSAGGRLDITVYSDSISISAVVPASAAQTVVKAMTTDYYAPVITQDGFDLAQRQVAQEAFFSNFDPQTVVRDAVFGQLFADGGPQHFPAEGSTADIGSLTLDAVRAFATRAFRAQNSVLVVSGAVDPGVITAAVPGRPDGSTPGAEAFANAPLAPSPAPVTRTFVEPSGGEGWVGPPISDTRAATALDFVADYLFRPDAGVVTRDLNDGHPDIFVGGQFITLNDPGVMVVVFSGKGDSLRSTIDAALTSMQQPLDPAVFKTAIASFRGHLLSDLQTPRQLADNYGWYTVEGNPEYAPGAKGDAGLYFRTAAGLTPDFVAETVRTYLGKTGVLVSLVPQSDAKATNNQHPAPGRRAPLDLPGIKGGAPAPGSAATPAAAPVPAPTSAPGASQ